MLSSRWQRAKAETHGLKNWRGTAARTVLAAVLLVLALLTFGPIEGIAREVVGAGVLLLALVLAVAGELAWNMLLARRRLAEEEVARLTEENSELAAKAALADQHAEQAQLLQERWGKQQRAYAIVEAQNKVMWGVYGEQAKGIAVPLDAVLARIDIETKVATQEWGDKRDAA